MLPNSAAVALQSACRQARALVTTRATETRPASTPIARDDSAPSVPIEGAPTFQEAIARLQEYWASVGCAVWLPHNTEVLRWRRPHCRAAAAPPVPLSTGELPHPPGPAPQVGAGTMNPATFLRVLGPEPWNVCYAEPSIRPDDSRYGDNPNRIQRHTQFQASGACAREMPGASGVYQPSRAALPCPARPAAPSSRRRRRPRLPLLLAALLLALACPVTPPSPPLPSPPLPSPFRPCFLVRRSS
jgi:hypothetical protein